MSKRAMRLDSVIMATSFILPLQVGHSRTSIANGSAVTPEGRLVVFARGTDNATWHKYYDGGWSSWTSLGGVLTSSPTGI